ncbi:ABC transporter, putative [Bodo saltans]|uniref:ABC transporter, putative n=1 Tax=Bodo saltans TaxID=75058 RepID=A0A0S4JQ43_BODSA|nr:ABC transporter, putative [Bodo saltans]|eukprot:CUG92304.1 ABC transporter, putative [Bodo saltans]
MRVTRRLCCQLAATTVLGGSAVFIGFLFHRRHVSVNRPRAPHRITAPFLTGEVAVHASVPIKHQIQRFLVLWIRLMQLSIRLSWAVVVLVYSSAAAVNAAHDAMLQFLTECGPTYIKLGQWLASRPDLFSPEMCRVLAKLFDHAPAHSWDHTNKVLRDEGVLVHLASIESMPINSGSVAQVHRGVLRNDVDGIPAGTAVAVKVLHPDIHSTIAADLAIMRLGVRLLEAVVPGAVYFDFRRALDEFGALLQSQLDLRRECDNLAQFRYNFRDFSGVCFPTPAPTITTSAVLVETFEEGIPFQTFIRQGSDEGLADIGCHMFLKMLFEDNFVHSDLHPGNVLVRKHAKGSKLVVLDPGLVTVLSPVERDNFISLFAAVACGDGDLGAGLMLDRMPRGNDVLDRDKFKLEVKRIFDEVAPGTAGFRLSDVDIGAVLSRLLNAVRKHHATIDGNFASLVVTVIVGEGLGRRLDANFNMFEEAAPYMIQYLEAGELKFLAAKLSEMFGRRVMGQTS